MLPMDEYIQCLEGPEIKVNIAKGASQPTVKLMIFFLFMHPKPV